jgi:hypothetical protein
VLAALPQGAKPSLRLTCRAARDAVDAHARRLEVVHGCSLIGATAAARMPLLQELELSAYDDTAVLALAAALRAVAQGPAKLRRITVVAHGGGSALGGLVSALAGLAALTCLELGVELEESQCKDVPPLVLPWARIEVGAGGLRPAGSVAGRGVLLEVRDDACPLDALRRT